LFGGGGVMHNNSLSKTLYVFIMFGAKKILHSLSQLLVSDWDQNVSTVMEFCPPPHKSVLPCYSASLQYQ